MTLQTASLLCGLRRAVVVLLASALTACGGSVGTGGTGQTADYTAGPITGFGSVIVGGVRFDDSAAEVQDEDGVRRSRDDLRLGMTVEVQSDSITSGSSGATARAARIRFESELNGPVGIVSQATSSFTILGQNVSVDATTVFDDRLSGGLAGLRFADLVRVYAVFDVALQRYRATRVEPSTALAGLRLRGPVTALNTQAQTLNIGAVTYPFAGAPNVPAGLAVGQYVLLRLEFESLRNGWVVRGFGEALPTLPDADRAKVEGLITSFTSPATFSVGGRAVDASAASVGGSGSLAVGVRVEVEGSVRLGLLRATRVTIKSDDDIRDRFELFGPITAVNAAQATIVVRGTTVSTAGPNLRYDNGGPADLQVGRPVEVRGQLAADRRTLEATRIRFR
jgi:hypothetical protein